MTSDTHFSINSYKSIHMVQFSIKKIFFQQDETGKFNSNTRYTIAFITRTR